MDTELAQSPELRVDLNCNEKLAKSSGVSQLITFETGLKKMKFDLD